MAERPKEISVQYIAGSLTLTEQKLPQAWYELRSVWPLRLLGALGGAYTGLYFSQFGVPESFLSSLLAIGLYYVSDTFDSNSTERAFYAADCAHQANIKHGVHENNPFLRGINSSEEYVNNPRSYLPLAIGSVMSAAFPPVSLPMAAIKTLCALSNYRLARRLDLATQIALNKPHNPQAIS